MKNIVVPVSQARRGDKPGLPKTFTPPEPATTPPSSSHESHRQREDRSLQQSLATLLAGTPYLDLANSESKAYSRKIVSSLRRKVEDHIDFSKVFKKIVSLFRFMKKHPCKHIAHYLLQRRMKLETVGKLTKKSEAELLEFEKMLKEAHQRQKRRTAAPAPAESNKIPHPDRLVTRDPKGVIVSKNPRLLISNKLHTADVARNIPHLTAVGNYDINNTKINRKTAPVEIVAPPAEEMAPEPSKFDKEIDHLTEKFYKRSLAILEGHMPNPTVSLMDRRKSAKSSVAKLLTTPMNTNDDGMLEQGNWEEFGQETLAAAAPMPKQWTSEQAETGTKEPEQPKKAKEPLPDHYFKVFSGKFSLSDPLGHSKKKFRVELMATFSQETIAKFGSIKDGLHLSMKMSNQEFQQYFDKVLLSPQKHDYSVLPCFMTSHSQAMILNHLESRSSVASMKYSETCKIFIFPISKSSHLSAFIAISLMKHEWLDVLNYVVVKDNSKLSQVDDSAMQQEELPDKPQALPRGVISSASLSPFSLLTLLVCKHSPNQKDLHTMKSGLTPFLHSGVRPERMELTAQKSLCILKPDPEVQDRRLLTTSLTSFLAQHQDLPQDPDTILTLAGLKLYGLQEYHDFVQNNLKQADDAAAALLKEGKRSVVDGKASASAT